MNASSSVQCIDCAPLPVGKAVIAEGKVITVDGAVTSAEPFVGRVVLGEDGELMWYLGSRILRMYSEDRIVVHGWRPAAPGVAFAWLWDRSETSAWEDAA